MHVLQINLSGDSQKEAISGRDDENREDNNGEQSCKVNPFDLVGSSLKKEKDGADEGLEDAIETELRPVEGGISSSVGLAHASKTTSAKF